MTATLNTPSSEIDTQWGAGANPFDELRPVLRSEEDDIRKGIFSTALKRLRTITPEEKIDWCVAIQEATAPKVAVGVKRARQTVPDEPPTTVTATSAEATLTEAAPTASAATESRERQASAESSQAEAAASVRAFTQEAAAAYVASFMRAQLDKVVGGSLNNLGVAALRVLCLMLGITTRARGKDALYNTLASYYYTHCEKLGKRVSRDTVSKNLAEQEAVMMNRLLPSATAKRQSHKSAHKNATRDSQPEPVDKENAHHASTRTGNATKAQLTASATHQRVETSHGSTRGQPRATVAVAKTTVTSRTTTSTAATSADVAYGGRLFSRPDASAVPSSSGAVAAEEEPALCGVALERKVASIIQLYDPVTVDIVVKKLAQFGFRDANAPAIVEDILRTFHKKQLIFFDSGIAYMM